MPTNDLQRSLYDGNEPSTWTQCGWQPTWHTDPFLLYLLTMKLRLAGAFYAQGRPCEI
jgi:hypothetical protein